MNCCNGRGCDPPNHIVPPLGANNKHALRGLDHGHLAFFYGPGLPKVVIDYCLQWKFSVGQLFDGVEKKEDLKKFLIESGKLILTVVVPHLWQLQEF